MKSRQHVIRKKEGSNNLLETKLKKNSYNAPAFAQPVHYNYVIFA
jgi:hypothetical protein